MNATNAAFRALSAFALVSSFTPFVAAQTPGSPQSPGRGADPRLTIGAMQGIAASLGVTCEYCHPPRGTPPPPPDVKSKREIAREMLAMVDEINARVVAVTGKPPTEATRVQCSTCHRGVPIPKQLADIMWKTAGEQGGAAAVAQYRELRQRFYGRQAYDFGEDELITVAYRLAQIKPDDAIPLLQLNLEYYPKSIRTLTTIAQAYTRKLDDASALTYLEKALEIDPMNGVIQGQVLQLQRIVRR